MCCVGGKIYLSFLFLFSFFFFSFLNKPVAGCGVVSSFERMCEGMICLQMAVFWCVCKRVCVFLCLRTHVSWVCCKVMSVSPQTTAVMWHWLTQPLQSPHRSLLSVFFFLDRCPLTNTPLLLNIDGRAPSLSLYLSSFISFSFWASTPTSLLLPLSMRPLYSAFQSWTGGLSVPRSHWPRPTTWPWSGPPCSAIRPALWVFTWNNSTAAVGREQGPGERQRERERQRSPKWTWLTYSNISFVSFQLSSSSVAPL